MTGARLKEIMTVVLAQHRLSQSRLAEMIGVSQQYISSRYAAKDVPAGFIEKVCQALSLDISVFFPELSRGVHNVTEVRHDGDSQHGCVNNYNGVDVDTFNSILQQNNMLLGYFLSHGIAVPPVGEKDKDKDK